MFWDMTWLEKIIFLKKIISSYTIKTVKGIIASFSDSAGEPAIAVNVDITPVQDLNGYDSPWVGGGHYNQWDEEWEQGIYNNSGNPESSSANIRSKNAITVSPSTTYYAYINSSPSIKVLYYDADDALISYETKQRATFTTPANAVSVRFSTINYGGTTYKNDIAINYPSTITTYSPYSNICPISGRSSVGVTVTDDVDNPTVTDTYTIPLGQTVYGGDVEVVSGVCSDTMAIATDFSTVNMSLGSVQGGGSYRARIKFDAKSHDESAVGNIYCNVLPTDTAVNNYKKSQSVAASNTDGEFYVYVDSLQTVNDYRQWLADNNAVIVYEKTTPTTIQLTPTEISTLQGNNNVWSDAGGEIEVTYIAER